MKVCRNLRRKESLTNFKDHWLIRPGSDNGYLYKDTILFSLQCSDRQDGLGGKDAVRQNS